MIKAIITKAYEEAYGGEEDPATVDYCIIPVSASNKRTLGLLRSVMERAKELGVSSPQVCGEIKAGWFEESEWEEAGLPDLPDEFSDTGSVVMDLELDGGVLEGSKVILSYDGSFYVERIDDFKPRSQYIRWEGKANAEAAPV